MEKEWKSTCNMCKAFEAIMNYVPRVMKSTIKFLEQ